MLEHKPKFLSFVPTHQKEGDNNQQVGTPTLSHYIIALPDPTDNKEFKERASTCTMKCDKIESKFNAQYPDELRGFWIKIYSKEQGALIWDEFKALPKTSIAEIEEPGFANLNEKAAEKASVQVVKAEAHGPTVFALLGPGNFLIQAPLERHAGTDQIFMKVEDALPGVDGYIFRFDTNQISLGDVKKVCMQFGFNCDIFMDFA